VTLTKIKIRTGGSLLARSSGRLNRRQFTRHPPTSVDSAPGHHLKLKKPLRSRWGFCFGGLVTGCLY